MKNLIKKIYESTMNTGGASYHLNGSTPKSGFMVSQVGAEKIISLKDFTEEIIENFVNENIKKLSNNEDLCVGTWESEGQVYFDISENIQDKNKAISEGLKNNQLAIFDLSTFESIML